MEANRKYSWSLFSNEIRLDPTNKTDYCEQKCLWLNNQFCYWEVIKLPKEKFINNT